MECYSNTQLRLSNRHLLPLICLKDKEVSLFWFKYLLVNLKLGGVSNQIEFLKAPEIKEGRE